MESLHKIILEKGKTSYTILEENNGILKLRADTEWKCKCCGQRIFTQHRIVYKKKPDIPDIEW